MQFGAAGDGITDDTAAIGAAIAMAQSTAQDVVFPAGTYLTAPQQITSRVRLLLAPGATLKLAAIAYTQGVTPQEQGILTIGAGADGTEVIGGTFDGNRSQLASSYQAVIATAANPLIVFAAIWAAASHVTVRDATIRDFEVWGFGDVGKYNTFEHIKIWNCGKGFLAGFSYESSYSDIDEQSIGGISLSLPGNQVWQHANEWYQNDACTFRNVTLTGFAPNRNAHDAVPVGMLIEGSRNCTYENLHLEGFNGTSGVGTTASDALGVKAYGLSRSQLGKIRVIGYGSGMQLDSAENVTLSDVFLDGQYTARSPTLHDPAFPSHGLAFWSGGVAAQAPGAATVLLNSAGSSITVSNGTITRFLDGLYSNASNLSVANVEITGNARHGVIIEAGNSNGAFPGATSVLQVPQNVRMVGGKIAFNGSNGVFAPAFDGLSFDGVSIVDNGQDFTLDLGSRAGIRTAGAGPQRALSASGLIGNTQTGLLREAISVVPGTTASSSTPPFAPNQYRMIAIRPDAFSVGQVVILKEAGDGGVDATVMIVDKSMDLLTVTPFPNSGGYTFGGNACLQVGTIGSNGTIVTGSGTSFGPAIKGNCFITAGGQYRRVVSARSDTALQTDTPFDPPLATGTPWALMATDVQLVPAQSFGIDPGASATGPFDIRAQFVGGPAVNPANGVGMFDAIRLNGAQVNYAGGLQPATPAGATQTGSMWMGTGVPSNRTGGDGDFYFRTDTPAVPAQRIYVKVVGAWMGIL